MSDEDRSQRADELEALSGIYEEKFCLTDEQSCRIEVDDGQTKSQYSLSLEVMFPPDYPSASPPTYQLNAPWLRGEERSRLCTALEDIYCENLGECIVFKWVERIRDFLVEKSTLGSDSKADGPADEEEARCSDQRHAELSDEDEGGYTDEYGFDPRLYVYTPPASSYSSQDSSGHEAVECPPIHHGELIKDRKSVFQGHLAPVTSKAQVRLVMESLMQSKKIAEATHNIVAYRISCGGEVYLTECVDDGETHAGARMLHLLEIVDARNVLVVVTRWYGGVHLGPDRFKHINNCTRLLLDQHGYVKDKSNDKKGTKGSSNQNAGHGGVDEPMASQRGAAQGQKHGKKTKR